MNDADVIFEWTVHPIADDPRRRVIFLSAVAVVLIVVWISFHDLFWVFFSLIFLIAALNAFVLPTRYRLSETELEIYRIRPIRKQRLSDIRRVDRTPNGFFLSPLRHPSRLENYRGILLPCPEQIEEIEQFLRARIRGTSHVNRDREDGP